MPPLFRLLLLALGCWAALSAPILVLGQSTATVQSSNNAALPVCPEQLPGKDNLRLFPKRVFSTNTDPVVPQYPFGGIAYGPFVDINGFSPVDTFGDKYTPYPQATDSSPAAITAAAIAQVRVCQLELQREFGAGSLHWKQDWSTTNMAVPSIPSVPNLMQTVVEETGFYARQVTPPPTLTLTQSPVIAGSALSGFYIGITPKAFDHKFAAEAEARYGCSMRTTAFHSALCPLIGGGNFSQARTDWNRFQSSSITPLTHTISLTADLNQEFACLRALLAQAGMTFRNVGLLRFTIPSTDQAAEQEFLAAYSAIQRTFPDNWKPAIIVENGLGLYDPKARIAVSIEMALHGLPGELLTAYNNPDVPSLPVYSQVVQTPAGWFWTAQMFPTTVNNIPAANPANFYYVLQYVDPALIAVLHEFLPTESVNGSIYAQWVAQQIQVFMNTANALAEIGVDISDVTYQYNVQGPGFILPFFAISDASTIIFTGSQGKSGLNLPQRDDSPTSGVPYYGGALPAPYSYYGSVQSSRFVGLDRQNFMAPANNNGATLGVTNYLVCSGSTDITTCPQYLQSNLGAMYQPTRRLEIPLKYEELQPQDDPF